MQGRGFVRARLQAQWSLLLACAVLLLAGSTVLTGLVLHASTTATNGVRDRLTTLPASQRLVELSMPSASEDLVAGSEAAVLDDVDRTFGSRGFRPDVAVSARSGLTRVTGPLGDSPEGPIRLVGVAYRDLPTHAEVVDGGWPGAGLTPDGVPVALHATAADRLGVGVGDTVPVELGSEPVTLVVTGTWRPRDRDDAYFAGEPLEVDGAQGPTTLGPFVPGEPGVLGRATLRFRVLPDLAAVQPAQLPALRRAVTRLELVARQDSRLTSVAVSGQLERHLEALTSQSVAASSVAAVPVVVVGILLASGLLLTAGLLVERRSGQTRLVRARGASAAQVAGWTAAEGALLALPAAVLAAPLAWLVLRTAAAVPASPPPSAGWWVASATGLCGATLLLLPPAVAARRWSVVTAPPGRRRDAGRVGAELAPVAAAAVAVWQLRRYAGTSVPLRTGDVAADPLLVAAPALALLAGAVVAARLVPVLGSVVASWAARREGASAALAGWEVARRPGTHAPAVLLLTLAIGAGLVATGYSASWRAHVDTRAGLMVGGDLQVPLRDGGTGALQRITGVTAVVPYSAEPSTLGSTPTTLLMADGEGMQHLPNAEAASRLAARGGGQLPAVVTRDIAESNALSAGSLVSLQHDGRRLTARVVAVADALPAVTGSAVLVDLQALSTLDVSDGEAAVVPDRAWVALDEATRGDGDLRAAAVDQVREVSGGQEVLDRVEVSRALAGAQPAGGVPGLLLTGAVAALVLAAAGLGVAGAAAARRRRLEQAVLRAIGASANELRRVSAAESAGVGVVALVAGTAVGWLVAWLCVPALVLGVAGAGGAAVTGATVGTAAPVTAGGVVAVLLPAAGLVAAVGVARAVATRRRPPASDDRLGVDP